MGADKLKSERGGVRFQGDWPLCYRVNLQSRSAGRILWQVGHGRYANETDLYQLASSLEWHRWFSVDRSFKIRVTAINSPLKSINFAALKVKDAVCDAFRVSDGRRPNVELHRPDVTLHLFLKRHDFTLYIDTTGEALFKRGYRVQEVEAPLRENLAAGILRLADWQPGTPLLDPMCGSGTFLAEAAMMALGMAPGLGREFAFQKLRVFDQSLWDEACHAASDEETEPQSLAIFGRDRDQGAIEASRDNLKALGVLESVQLGHITAEEGEAPATTGLIVCNPPYGERLGERKALTRLYGEWGRRLKSSFVGWTAWVLSGDESLPRGLGMRPTREIKLYNGALEVRLYRFDIYPPKD
ncbi:MAG: class I SAM-dependent RNA methyltransferase [Gammaproteobacteria bacterium]|nr:class I SAM-dependent RNA methyltransferase [Gammaproteobacteria bacterium]